MTKAEWVRTEGIDREKTRKNVNEVPPPVMGRRGDGEQRGNRDAG